MRLFDELKSELQKVEEEAKEFRAQYPRSDASQKKYKEMTEKGVAIYVQFQTLIAKLYYKTQDTPKELFFDVFLAAAKHLNQMCMYCITVYKNLSDKTELQIKYAYLNELMEYNKPRGLTINAAFKCGTETQQQKMDSTLTKYYESNATIEGFEISLSIAHSLIGSKKHQNHDVAEEHVNSNKRQKLKEENVGTTSSCSM